ncbi:MAG: hypothetical protein KME52_22980 [Desmonostoc geniculatum HA4340-LM1]|jgi:hypothetical protein|nr:hypothetical protein [Desmonostoc geniculatum HA4340-LM1]
MSTLYTINVTNNSPNLQNFFFFQKPAIYSGGQTVYTNSIYSQPLEPYSTSGAVLTFQLLQQYYAGVQTATGTPVVGEASGYTTASQPIDLTTIGKETNNCTQMSVNPSLGLSVPTYADGVLGGAYRIVTPPFDPTLRDYNLGLAMKNIQTGSVVLSNFISAEPSKNIDCQPVVIFYVQSGSYQAGSVINFTSSSVGSATCDTTPGYTTFNVSYNLDGSWTVNPVHDQPGLSQLIGSYQSIQSSVKERTYAYTATLVFGSLAVASWAYDNQTLIANTANVVISHFSNFDRAARTFKVLGNSALACASAMEAIVKAIKENAPKQVLIADYESSDTVVVSYKDLVCNMVAV